MSYSRPTDPAPRSSPDDDLVVVIPGFDPPATTGKQALVEVDPTLEDLARSPYDPIIAARAFGHVTGEVARNPPQGSGISFGVFVVGLTLVLIGALTVRTTLANLGDGAGLPAVVTQAGTSALALALGVAGATMLWRLFRAAQRPTMTPEDLEDDRAEETAPGQVIYSVNLPWDARAAVGATFAIDGETTSPPDRLEIVLIGGRPGVWLHLMDDEGEVAHRWFPSIDDALAASEEWLGIRPDEWVAPREGASPPDTQRV